MKKILLAAVAGMLLVACNNVKQFQAPIEALSTQWDAATTGVTDFATMLTQEIANSQTMASGLQVSEDVLKKLDDASKTKLSELESMFQQESQQMATINDELNGFVASWGEKTQKLTELKDGLANGKLGKETQAVITELQTAATEATTQVGTWTERMTQSKAKLAEIAKQHANALAGNSN
ncbi:MAG: hypothetical protein IPL49_09715 [Saprospirales bacterium]|nr:hypothetical protein [Saprospirales bacterium]MBK8491143.1 hypothetical protein [Saprospirales bacterium]